MKTEKEKWSEALGSLSSGRAEIMKKMDEMKVGIDGVVENTKKEVEDDPAARLAEAMRRLSEEQMKRRPQAVVEQFTPLFQDLLKRPRGVEGFGREREFLFAKLMGAARAVGETPQQRLENFNKIMEQLPDRIKALIPLKKIAEEKLFMGKVGPTGETTYEKRIVERTVRLDQFVREQLEAALKEIPKVIMQKQITNPRIRAEELAGGLLEGTIDPTKIKEARLTDEELTAAIESVRAAQEKQAQMQRRMTELHEESIKAIRNNEMFMDFIPAMMNFMRSTGKMGEEVKKLTDQMNDFQTEMAVPI